MSDTDILNQEQVAEIEARANAATEGPWESDNEQDSEHRFQYYMVLDAESRTIFDTLNSSIGEIHEEADEDGVYRWDEVARRNIAFAAHARADIPALCRTLRAAWARVVELENERETDLIGRLGRQAADYLEECERLREQLAQYEQCVTCVACGRPSWHRKGDEPL